MSHHFRKPPTGHDRKNYDPLALENLRGASKWTDAADTITTLAREGASKHWWFLKTRWTTRHGEGLEDMMLKVTPEDDQSQVTFERMLGDAPGVGGLKLKPVGGKGG